MLHRLITLINVSIAVSLLLIAGIIYWYALRPLPKTSGNLAAPIDTAAVIKRDARGVPHIEAGSLADAVFLQGFATAQDRLWQMDGLRRFGAGELSEVFGPGTLRQDELSRRMRLRAIAERDWQQLDPRLRPVFEQYARGVNFYIDRNRGTYPLEYRLPGHEYEPRHWTPVDSILVGLVMFRDLTDNASFDLFRGNLLAQGADPVKVKRLFPASEGTFVNPGSNSWAVAGSRTANGSPLLANDPHLSYGIPPTWHLVHMKAPGLNVSGATLPGLPGVATGHNERIAWGVTNLQTDVMDLYREVIDERTGRYAFRGHTMQAQLARDVIKVRGAKPVTMTTWITEHGPVIGRAGGAPVSMRWTANEGLTYPFWDIDRATNWTEFRAALATFWGPAQNFIYADRAGHIGYQAAGRIPIRPNFDGDVPLDGVSGQFEWSGYIPFEQMPSRYDPPSGIVATANQNTFGTGFPFRITGTFADPYRIRQIQARLNAKRGLTVPDMLAVQKDVYSAYDRFLARQIVAAIGSPAAGSLEGEAVTVLRAWNGQMEKDQAAPAITQLVSGELARNLVLICFSPGGETGQSNARSVPNTPRAHEAKPTASVPTFNGGRGQSSAPGAGNKQVVVSGYVPRSFTIESLLRERPNEWVPKNDWDGWLRQRIHEALERGRQRQGKPVSRWRWGQILQWTFAHPVGKQLPLVDRFFDIGPVEMSGSGTTVKQTTATLGPSERMVVDLGALDQSVQNLTTGESGLVASGHYKDQWLAYYSGRSFPMQFESVDAKDILHLQPEGKQSKRQ